jgi:DNA mismatch repair protein MutL
MHLSTQNCNQAITNRKMPIQLLSSTAVRALGSGQILTDSVALVKELIENSLDAGASNITIEVSPNLVDIVQVRDNGSGIPPQDRDSACLRSHTSKISSFEDVQTVQTLGFRGEALSSAADQSETLILTTKIEGEATAAVLTVGRDGKVMGQKTTGAPVGTTVRVVGFLKRLPVRRENALKNTAKHWKMLKKILATYYLSRPSCRYSLKMLPKGGSTKGENRCLSFS